MHLPEIHSINELQAIILNSENNEYEIYKSELMEAFAIMKILPNSGNDWLYYLSAMNLINAWIGRNRKLNRGKLFGNLYFFKTYICEALSHVIKSGLFKSDIYLNINEA